jgi:hypothetical protein
MKKLLNISLLVLSCQCLMAQTEQTANQLSKDEKKAHWTLLFDGKNTTGWHNYLKNSVTGNAWNVKDGVLQLDPAIKEGRGDLVTDQEYENFELAIDWKIAEEGNSGIMFTVHEDTMYKATYATGPEYQLLDDKKAEDNKKPNHLAGSLYDIITPTSAAEHPAGEWNQTRIRLQNGELTFWLNGVETVKTRMWDEHWASLVAKSKFATWKGFAKFHKGHIALQDHGHHIEFRNIKIRQL